LFVPLIYLSSGWFFLRMRWRFARHRTAEVLAAACATGEAGLHDRLIGGVQASNALLRLRSLLLAITGLHLLVSPFTTPMLLKAHQTWHGHSGLDAALAGK